MNKAFFPRMFCLMMLMSFGNVLRAEDYVLDFSTKAGACGTYDVVDWSWDDGTVKWLLAGAHNTNGKVSTVSFGGKNNTKGVSYIKSSVPLTLVVDEVTLKVTEKVAEIKTFKLYVARDAAFTDVEEVVSLPAATGEVTFRPLAGEAWPAGLFYKIEVCWNNNTTTNKAAKIASITFKEGVPPPVYVIAASPNEEALGTVSVDGKTITASPATCVTYAEPAFEILEGDAEVTQEGNTFAVKPRSDCLIQINFIPLEIYSVQLDAGTGTLPGDWELLQAECSAPVVLPEAVAPCAGWAFAGWSEEQLSEETEDMPGLLPAGGYVPEKDVILYAVYKKQGQDEGVQEMRMLVGATAGWEINDKVILQKNGTNSYYILCDGAAIYSPVLDLSSVTGVSATVRSYYNKNVMIVADEAGNGWGTVTAGGTDLMFAAGVKAQGLAGFGRLKFSGSDATAARGIGVSSITISCNAVSLQYHSIPACEPGAGTGLYAPNKVSEFHVDGSTVRFHAEAGCLFEVYDVAGVLLGRRLTVEGANVASLPSGMYVLRIDGEVYKVAVPF